MEPGGSLPHSQEPVTCPCHHGMARRQVVDGGTASSYGG
jgi:hypothetical protein